MTGAIPLSWFDLSLAACLVVTAALLSLLLQLGITRSFLVAAVRMTIQLLLIGQVLTWLFAQRSLWLTLAAGCIM